MNEGDDKLLRRYRELARDEPPPAIDAAILAASRRAVASRPWSQRFAAPVSIAAVLVLAVGVTLNMQREQPGVEVAPAASEFRAPPSGMPDTPAPATAPAIASTPSAQGAPAADAFRPGDLARKSLPPKIPAERALKKEAATAPPVVAPQATRSGPRAFSAAPEEMRAAAPEARALAPEPLSEAPAAAAAPAAPARAAAAQAPRSEADPQARSPTNRAALAAAREKRELADAPAPAAKAQAAPPLPDPAAELERIARLRTEGRHEEADKALEEFFRNHPDHRIPDAMWDRLRRR
jgi:hypothetical protein